MSEKEILSSSYIIISAILSREANIGILAGNSMWLKKWRMKLEVFLNSQQQVVLRLTFSNK